MKLIWHSHSPGMPSGYGTPTALWVPKLREMGHEVVISAFTDPLPEYWKGFRVHNTIDGQYGASRLDGLARHERAHAIITLMDAWAMPPTALNSVPCPVINWIPVDTYPLGILDEEYFSQAKGIPVAMSEYGGTMLAEAGFGNRVVPYAYDPDVFNPGDRDKAREDLGTAGKFTVGINASNMERKALPEQLSAYAALWKDHPDAVLLLVNSNRNGYVRFDQLARKLDLPPEAVRWSFTGMLDNQGLADWYRALDVLSSCSLAEGFCLPVIEAQACGTPVIVTDAPPVNQEAGAIGRHVSCERSWSAMHQAWWYRPSVSSLHRHLENAFRDRYNDRRTQAAEYAKKYVINAIAPRWTEILTEITGSGE